jgi:hypothetical protein
MVDIAEFNSNVRTTPVVFRPSTHMINLEAGNVPKLTERQSLLLPHKIPAYSLERKVWGLFDVRKISEMIYDEHAFEHLVLSEEKKHLISSLVTSASLKDNRFDDFIRGKGKSLIFLLHGEPGVGKTYTAGMLCLSV